MGISVTSPFIYKGAFNPVVAIDHSVIGVNYSLQGTVSGSIAIMIVESSVNKAFYISFDGTTDHIYIPATTNNLQKTFNLKSNYLVLQDGLKVYVKHAGSAPGSGILSIETVGI